VKINKFLSERSNIMDAENHTPGNADKLKEIPKWTRRYAQNRTLSVFVLIAITALIGGFVALPISLLIAAIMGGNVLVTGICAALFASVSLILIIFALKFGGKYRGLLDQKIDQWIYGREGYASLPASKSAKKKWLDVASGVAISICIIGSMHLAVEGYFAFKYLQPVSAIYLVPFLVFQYFLQQPRPGPLLLICPALYTIHAVLIVAGVPIYLTGNWGVLNMFIPLFGYTLLAYVIAHVYSRYALKKLKGLTHLEGGAANGD
jgi:hypothetical protein